MKTSRWAVALTAAGLCGCAGSQVRPDPKPVANAKPSAAQAPVIPNKAVVPPPAPTKSETTELLEKGAAAYRAGRFDEAKDAFEKAIAESPNDPKGHFDLGLTLDHQGDYQGAEKEYGKAHTLAPKDVSAALHLARLYRDGGELDRAVAVYEEALKAAPNEPTLLNALAASYRLKKDYPKAEAAARQALAHGGEVEAYKNLALIALEQGNLRLAELLCGNARKLAPNDAGIYNDLGLVYLKEADLPRALGQFQKAVSIDSSFAPAYVNLGALALRYRDYAGAEKNLAQAVKLAPSDPALHLALAYALDGQRGQDAKKGVAAGQEFERALAIQPENGDAICGAAWAYTADRSSFAKAKTFLERCRTLASTQAADKQRIDDKLKALAVMTPVAEPVENADASGDQDPPTDDDTEIASQPAPSDGQGVGGSGSANTPGVGPQSGSPTGTLQPAASQPPKGDGTGLGAAGTPATGSPVSPNGAVQPPATQPKTTGTSLDATTAPGSAGAQSVSSSGAAQPTATQPPKSKGTGLDAAADPATGGSQPASPNSAAPTKSDGTRAMSPGGSVQNPNSEGSGQGGSGVVQPVKSDAPPRGASESQPASPSGAVAPPLVPPPVADVSAADSVPPTDDAATSDDISTPAVDDRAGAAPTPTDITASAAGATNDAAGAIPAESQGAARSEVPAAQ